MRTPMSLSTPPDPDGDSSADTGAAPAAAAAPDDYKSKADMMTLIEANKIKADKARHGAAKAMAKTHLAHMSKVSKGE